MNVIKLGMFETLMIAVLAIYLGDFLREKFSVLKKYCLPASVVGGTLFAVIIMIFYSMNVVALEFDYKTVNTLFYCIFFAASGAAASMSLLRQGGKLVVIFAVLAAVLATLQNAVALGVGGIMGVNPLISMMTGSIPMTGGHGNAAAFSPIAVEAGAAAAKEVAISAATFGLIAGSILGGPFGNFLIKKYKFENPALDGKGYTESESDENKILFDKNAILRSVFLMCIACGIGQFGKLAVDSLDIKNLVFPIHVWCMLGGIIVRVGLDYTKKGNDRLYEAIDTVGEFSLALFVSMSIITMQLWQLADLGPQLLVLLVSQVVLIAIFCYFLTFFLLGKNYDSAIMAVGHMGFGLGAVPVSMTTMQAVCKKYRYSKLAFFVVPVIGGFISNLSNAVIIGKFLDLAIYLASK